MNKNSAKCDKCKQTLGYPYYNLLIKEEHLDNKKNFCLGCWRQEEKNYRKLSEKGFAQPSYSLGLKHIHKHDKPTEHGHGTETRGITIIHWVEDLKQWRCGRNQDDYDEDVDTSEPTPINREREREQAFNQRGSFLCRL